MTEASERKYRDEGRSNDQVAAEEETQEQSAQTNVASEARQGAESDAASEAGAE